MMYGLPKSPKFSRKMYCNKLIDLSKCETLADSASLVPPVETGVGFIPVFNGCSTNQAAAVF